MSGVLTEQAGAEQKAGGRAGQWVGAFFTDADRLDLPAMMRWFADDIDLRIGNMPPVLGHAAVEQSFAEFWANLDGMHHERVELITAPSDLDAAQMSIVTYTRKDGKIISMPTATHLRRTASGALNRLWIYIDINPLFA
jgi:ketosteroid isomerase-like protein